MILLSHNDFLSPCMATHSTLYELIAVNGQTTTSASYKVVYSNSI